MAPFVIINNRHQSTSFLSVVYQLFITQNDERKRERKEGGKEGRKEGERGEEEKKREWEGSRSE